MDSYGLIGRKLSHSLSPQIHAMFGINYKLYQLEPQQLEEFLSAKKLKGINVTVPYKQSVIPYLNEIDETAKTVGAVNTIVCKNEKLYGYNTDIGGLEYALKRAKIELKGKKVAILGSGGTSKTAEYVAKKCSAETIIKIGRTSEINYSSVYDIKDIEVIINTTPVGMFPDCNSLILDLEKFPKLSGVFDVVYNPLQTKLVALAKKLGINAANGLAMLVEQARLSYNLFTNANSSISLTEDTLSRLYKSLVNIVLIGMPGCGKTTLAKELAKKLNRPIIDLDEDISAKCEKPIEDIINLFGEEFFRNEELLAAKRAGQKKGVIISTGGGTVCFKNASEALSLNGIMILIERELNKLSVCGRPLSNKKGVEAIYAERKKIYQSLAHFTVNNDDFDKAIKELIKIYEKNISY